VFVGEVDGIIVAGDWVGVALGMKVDGENDGYPEGLEDGPVVGFIEGIVVVGDFDGSVIEGDRVGSSDGFTTGGADGFVEGEFDGPAEGRVIAGD
jgi:hypothetical protein